jgi:L-alanine-DL-glutamate epimerase-like enolase superfamily enzyme
MTQGIEENIAVSTGFSYPAGSPHLSERPVRIDELSVSAFEIPTDAPESDGTYQWQSTTLVVVTLTAAGENGIGFTYADTATAKLIYHQMRPILIGCDAFSVRANWDIMVRSIRNLGRAGICAMAISAIDTAFWDLKAKLLGLPLVRLFGQVRHALPLYGSGGFTSYSIDRLQNQLGDWAARGISRVKMKVGRDPRADIERVAAARQAIGRNSGLFVDANGAYSRKQALVQANRFVESDVVWFEEPVSSDDLDGLRLVRDRAPARVEIAAGEYGYDIGYFNRMLQAGAVDVLQMDATRCGGFTGLLEAASLCELHQIELSTHCAPALHLHLGCAVPRIRHAEYFYDHVRIERMLFDGVIDPVGGELAPDLSRPGLGLELKRRDAERFEVR